MNLDELRKIAESATPGPWYTNDYWGVSTSPVQHEAEWTIVDTEGCGTSRPWDHDFIAAFNPQMVLALLDRVEAAEQEAEGWKQLYVDRGLKLVEQKKRAGRAEQAIARVREGHTPVERWVPVNEEKPWRGFNRDGDKCERCNQVYPCPTINALEGDE